MAFFEHVKYNRDSASGFAPLLPPAALLSGPLLEAPHPDPIIGWHSAPAMASEPCQGATLAKTGSADKVESNYRAAYN